MALLGVASLTANTAHAGGYGLYTEFEHAWTSVDGDLAFNSGKVNRDFDDSMGGVGFLYDTNVATDTLINYRIRVGYRAGKRNWNKNKLSLSLGAHAKKTPSAITRNSGKTQRPSKA